MSTLPEIIAQIDQDKERFRELVNGDENQTVELESRIELSIAGQIKARVDPLIVSITEDADGAVALATAQADRAEDEADRAELNADIAAGAVSGSVNTFFAATKAAGDTLAASLADGATVIIDEDEAATPAGVQTRRGVTGGVLGAPVNVLDAGQVARGVVAVNSVADLLALSASDRKAGTRYETRGYYSDSVDGACAYYWDSGSSATANGGTILEIPSVSGRFIAISGSVITPMTFGARTAFANDSGQKVMDFFSAAALAPRKYAYELIGEYNTSVTVVLSGYSDAYMSMDASIIATAALPVVVRFVNCARAQMPGILRVSGTGSTSLASNTCVDGVNFEGCQRSHFGHIFTQYGTGWGVKEVGTNNNAMRVQTIEPQNFGASARSTRIHKVTAVSFSTSGSSGSSNQRSLLSVTGLDGFPIGTDAYLIVNGFPHSIQALDVGAGTLSVFPWLKTADQVIGSEFDLVYGGGAIIGRQAGAKIEAGAIIPTRCGIGAMLVGTSAPNVGRFISQFSGIALALGGIDNGTFSGSDISSAYFEAEQVAEIVANSGSATFSNGSTIACVTSIDPSRWFSLRPRDSGGGILPNRYFPVEILASNLRWPCTDFRDIATSSSNDASSYTLSNSRNVGSPLHVQIFRSTVTLNLVDDKPYRALKGAAILQAVITGGGANKNYTGGLFVAAQSGYTVNGLASPIRLAVNTNVYRINAWLTSETNWQIAVEDLSVPTYF